MQQMKDDKIHRFNIYEIRFQVFLVLVCVIISRILILFIFYNWKKETGFESGFFDAFSSFDTVWYKSIITDGYSVEPFMGDKQDTANWAFFPLLPFIIRMIHTIIPINIDLLGFFVNSGFLILALLLAIKYILMTRNDEVQAIVFVLLMTFGIYNFYFSTLYTESFFLLLIIAFFYCMERKKYVCMGMIGALASATRNIGIMLVFAVAAHYIQEYFFYNKFKLKTFLLMFFGNIRLVIGTTLIPFGLFSYMLYLYFLTGDSLAFVHIQRGWGRGEISNPFIILWNSLTNIDSFVFYLSLFSVWGIYCVWLLVWKKRWAEMIMTLLIVFIPLSTSVDSMPRYLICSFLPLLSFTDGISQWRKNKIIFLLLFSMVLGYICLCGWFASSPFVM